MNPWLWWALAFILAKVALYAVLVATDRYPHGERSPEERQDELRGVVGNLAMDR